MAEGRVPIGIGENTKITDGDLQAGAFEIVDASLKGAYDEKSMGKALRLLPAYIVDKNVRIGKNVVITNSEAGAFEIVDESLKGAYDEESMGKALRLLPAYIVDKNVRIGKNVVIANSEAGAFEIVDESLKGAYDEESMGKALRLLPVMGMQAEHLRKWGELKGAYDEESMGKALRLLTSKLCFAYYLTKYSYNIQGLGSKAKKDWTRELIGKHNVNFLSLQKTKMESISDMDVKILWGNSNFEYLFSEAIGNSGGILCTWDPNIFLKEQHILSDNFVALFGTWVPSKTKLLMISIYAPQPRTEKRSLWNYIMSLVTRWQGDSIVMGDFNEVRSADERMGSVFNIPGAADFNDFIFNLGHLSDHRPILLRDVIADYGATPFWMYYSRLTLSGFEQLVIHTWNSTVLEDSRRNDIKLKLSVIDKQLDQGRVNDDILLSRMGLMKQLLDSNSSDALDNLQKAKIQWAIEGDENSKFFHGVINRKRANLAIRGVMVDGEWVDDPRRVKEEFCSHFATRFHAPSGIRNKINFLFPNQLSSDQAFELEKQVSTDEIRTAVWACGENKSPGPDGFTFEFFRKFWDTIGPDLCLAVEWFFDHGSFSRGCNSSFIALIPKVQDPKFVNDYRPISLIGSLYKVVTKILALRLSSVIAGLISDVQTTFLPSRQILDGPFVINELLSWCKHKKQHAMIFKVDFAKAYDSVRWDFLDDVLQSFGFGFKWRSWILGSLSSEMASVLVNGSPIAEFQFHCGLKQGDPLAPYLSILVMESLHLSFSRVVDASIFKDIKIDNSTTISHLFYADDAVFVGEWSDDNLSSVMHALHCFSLASGLKINVKKSHLLGVGIHDLIVADAAFTLGCSIMKTPFKYLGVSVGGNMSKISAWDDIISKLNSRLSK
ncbi:RNA-directed DNA polymerase, eukaryota [Tanacetum coccineum]